VRCRQGILQFYRVLGSFNIIGNPLGLVSNLGTGVMDFFYEPSKGIIESPEAFAAGLGKGTLSLIRNSVYGTMNSVSKVRAYDGLLYANCLCISEDWRPFLSGDFDDQ
jgi:vacuolar protein sorting-associated protein 13A/C